jgi:hypothetical protein
MVRLRLLIIVVMLVMVTGKAGAEQFIPDPDVQGKINDARQDISLTGKIAYAKELGGYFFQTEKAGNKVILNQNYDTLKKLAQSRQAVKIQGRISPVDIKARHIYLEKIDAQPYQGDKAPLVRPPTKLTPLF